MYPLGNCDSFKRETRLNYLIRLGMVSLHPSPRQFLLRVTDGARTPPEELVNIASFTQTLRLDLEGQRQPA
jgi:hypothetical protein